MFSHELDSVESILATLGAIADKLASDSKESHALRIAAFAMLYLQQEQLVEKLTQFIERADSPLSAEQEAFLRRIGLNEEE